MERKIVASAGTTVSSGGGVAGRYATALYALADEQNALDSAVSEMASLGQLIDQSADFRRLLASPLIDVVHARAAALAVLRQEGFSKVVCDFVGVVVSNRRISILREIVQTFATLVDDKRGLITARIESAHPLSDLQRQQLQARLIEAGYGNVRIHETVDPTLLGGLVVRVGARLYDTSLKSRLQRLQFAMKGAA